MKQTEEHCDDVVISTLRSKLDSKIALRMWDKYCIKEVDAYSIISPIFGHE